MMARLAVFISGSGTNLQALIDAVGDGRLKAEIGLVVSNRKAAYGLVRAEQAGIATLYFPLKPYTEHGLSRDAYDSDLAERVRAYRPDLLVLAGWMHVMGAGFIACFPGQIINLHPALPGAFPGTDAITRTFAAYQRGEGTGGGCMVHYVVPEVDAGTVIAQASVPIEPEDTLDTFEARMHDAEHQIIVEAVRIALERGQFIPDSPL
jgi:formyltetrahydrofolate-dependent phosphoribosylglycinamide formyltransferase